MIGYDYGNARVRAMRSRLLDRDTYDELLAAADPEAVLGALARTPYGPEVEAARPGRTGLGHLDETLRRNLARTLHAVASYYGGEARRRVDLLLRRWDRRNLLTIVRGHARHHPAERIQGLLVPAGVIDETALRELVRQPGLRAAIDLMVSWELPSIEAAQALLAAWPEYERTRAIAVLERAVTDAHAADLARALAAGDANDAVAQLIDLERQEQSLLVALRTWEMQQAGERA